MSIEDAAAELYGVPLSEFTARRNALSRAAKTAGDTELAKTIAGLRKPTTAAWVVNMLARHRAERMADIAALGEELRDAQDALDAPRLRDLGKQRSALVRAVTGEAVALAEELGAAASAAVSEEIAQTLQTAMIDADAAALVGSGALVAPLTAAGWGLEEGGDVIAFPTAARRAERQGAKRQVPAQDGAASTGAGGSDAGGSGSGGSGAAARKAAREAAREQAREQAQRDLDEAEEALASARHHDDELRAKAEAAAERRATLREEVAELTRQLREAESELEDVEREARSIRRSRDESKRQVTAAERAVTRARTRAERE